ncbi:glycerate kinase [Nocardioides insulae]|uniref:glycerate kinase family protein n=1 Tax=Nocardioides insulae TaxID=394734 RepID=UPI0004908521|nr:glycerate kinase [Nocardioides insulae]
MRILVAPDAFAGTLSAPQAAEAIATGWREHAPADDVIPVPMSDGGPGFVDVLHGVLGGERRTITVRGPHGRPTPADILRVGDTAYLESAQACGVHLTGRSGAEHASTYGVGELVRAAVESGAGRIIVGLGGSGTNDGGAGLLAALGAEADVPLDAGCGGLDGISRMDLARASALVAGIELVAASDVDNPLTGLFGTTKVFGPQKGLAEDELPRLDALLGAYAAAAGRRTATEAGAGAAGGLGYALLLLGAECRPGVDLVAGVLGLAGHAARCDLVLTGEGSFDFSSRAGKVPAGVAALAGQAIRPCVVLAGQVHVGSREMRTLGVEAAYSLVDLVGEERAFADPEGALAAVAERVARSWSR